MIDLRGYLARITSPEDYEIPQEILFRFNPGLVRLRPPETDDYAQAIGRKNQGWPV